ncbi:4146_t:CDS:2 [Funneliformis caledonium]|uniref:4146_t:CDS:1 n=1 Tax=Funneliformis caledonium TaxID=1117310 RepID=A0A9N9CK48_9GLOM|nr:4146_t:CDS:2 [Funneliformis caledonium]
MSKNYSIYIVLWFLIRLVIEVNCQNTPFKPLKRYAHTATLIDNKLYILGGRLDSTSNNENIGGQFFYLDVSEPFNIKNIVWHDLTEINVIPAHRAATSARGGAYNDTLFLYGAKTDRPIVMELFYTFDTKSNSWSIPKLVENGDNIKTKHNVKGIVDDNGKMYLFGGNHKNRTTFYDDMLILDTINFNLNMGSLVNAPTQRILYGATFVPNNFIIYFGGSMDDANNAYPLKEVYLYDTIDDNWSTTLGTIPSDRNAFSTVLGLDGQRIIIFGGANININILLPYALYVLNLTNFEWSIPKTSGKKPAESRRWHEANVVGNYMVITFGMGKNEDEIDKDDEILLLDISNNEEYIWTNDFIPSTKQSAKLSIPVIIGIIIGTGIFLSVGSFFLYKRNISNKKNRYERETQ